MVFVKASTIVKKYPIYSNTSQARDRMTKLDMFVKLQYLHQKIPLPGI